MRNTCGLYVRKFVQKNRKTIQSCTHYTHLQNSSLFFQILYPLFYSPHTHILHNKSMQNIPVITTLYTLYTGPITTTTLNIYKKGM
jgi:hypothetical protein